MKNLSQFRTSVVVFSAAILGIVSVVFDHDNSHSLVGDATGSIVEGVRAHEAAAASATPQTTQASASPFGTFQGLPQQRRSWASATEDNAGSIDPATRPPQSQERGEPLPPPDPSMIRK